MPTCIESIVLLKNNIDYYQMLELHINLTYNTYTKKNE